MNIPVQDRSHYLRGLLVLVIKDNKINLEEKNLLLQIGKILGFEKKFCENAIDEALENRYLQTSIPKFSEPEFARSFIIDGFKLALVDNEFDPSELEFLKSVLKENDLEEHWFLEEIKKYVQNYDYKSLNSKLEVEQYLLD